MRQGTEWIKTLSAEELERQIKLVNEDISVLLNYSQRGGEPNISAQLEMLDLLQMRLEELKIGEI